MAAREAVKVFRKRDAAAQGKFGLTRPLLPRGVESAIGLASFGFSVASLYIGIAGKSKIKLSHIDLIVKKLKDAEEKMTEIDQDILGVEAAVRNNKELLGRCFFRHLCGSWSGSFSSFSQPMEVAVEAGADVEPVTEANAD